MKEHIHKCKAKKTRVVAKLTDEKGNVFVGVNLESSCHTLSICAERAAIVGAVNAQGPDFVIRTLQVYAEKEGQVLDIVPCGSCRQLVSEFADGLTTLCGKGMDYWMPNPYK